MVVLVSLTELQEKELQYAEFRPQSGVRIARLEEPVLDAWVQARAELVRTLGAIKKDYERLVLSFRDQDMMTGIILGALNSLTYYANDELIREKDTYHCCLALHDCTKYLACDDKYKDKEWPSKDDRFKGIYQNNYHFRRTWVAFLRQIEQYVLLINADDTESGLKLYEDVTALKAMHKMPNWFNGYNWTAITASIDTAQQKIDQEPQQAPWSNYIPFDWHRNAVLQCADGRERQMTQLLEELQQLSVA